MNEHVNAVVAAIGGKIARLEQCRALLLELSGQGESAVGDRNAEPMPAAVPVRPMKPAQPRNGKVKPGLGNPKNNQERNARNVAIVAGLAEPFSRLMVARALGLTNHGGGSAITRWEKSGWVKKVAFGQFERTAKFPATNGEGSPAAGPKDSKVKLESLRAEYKRAMERCEVNTARDLRERIQELEGAI